MAHACRTATDGEDHMTAAWVDYVLESYHRTSVFLPVSGTNGELA